MTFQIAQGDDDNAACLAPSHTNYTRSEHDISTMKYMSGEISRERVSRSTKHRYRHSPDTHNTHQLQHLSLPGYFEINSHYGPLNDGRGGARRQPRSAALGARNSPAVRFTAKEGIEPPIKAQLKAGSTRTATTGVDSSSTTTCAFSALERCAFFRDIQWPLSHITVI